MVKAVEANTDQQWVVLYVKRWLMAPMQLPDGTLVERDRGTPQGSAVSPVLANLFMHYAFDTWLEREFPTVEFERYADDAVVHCVTERQARQVWAALAERMERSGCGCIPTRPRSCTARTAIGGARSECTSFTFLGYTFRPRKAKSGKTGTVLHVVPARDEPGGAQRRWASRSADGGCTGAPRTRSGQSWPNGSTRSCAGWMNYYGRFYRSELYPLLQRINTYLMRWARKKYKRLRAFKRFKAWWTGLVDRDSRTCSRTGHGCARSHGLDEKSGVTGDCHAPFRGSPGVRFPRATRLRVRHLDDPEFPAMVFERYVDDAVVHCESERQAQMLARRSGRGWSRSGCDCTRQDPDRVLQGRAAARLARAHRVHVPGVHVPSAQCQDRHGKIFTSFLPAISKDA